MSNKGKRPHFCKLTSTERKDVLQKLHDLVYHCATYHIFRGGLLFPVTQFNIINAMTLNTTCLGLTMELLHDDIASPFNALLPWELNLSLPPSLQPTTLQLQVNHHPWIDIFPVPSIRDALLRRTGQYDDEELCHDFFGQCEENECHVGLLVWGEAWDPLAYEISEMILQKWIWIVQDCPDIVRSTNYWRAKRGEKPLCVPS